MHQRSRHNLPTTEQPSGQRSAHKDELSLPVTAKRMQTAAMRTRSQVKTGNSNNSKVMDSNPHSGPMLRLRANRADNIYNTASRAENVPRQGRPRKTLYGGKWPTIIMEVLIYLIIITLYRNFIPQDKIHPSIYTPTSSTYSLLCREREGVDALAR